MPGVIVTVVGGDTVEGLAQAVAIGIVAIGCRVAIGVGGVGQTVEGIEGVALRAGVARHANPVAVGIECIVGKEQIAA